MLGGQQMMIGGGTSTSRSGRYVSSGVISHIPPTHNPPPTNVHVLTVNCFIVHFLINRHRKIEGDTSSVPNLFKTIVITLILTSSISCDVQVAVHECLHFYFSASRRSAKYKRYKNTLTRMTFQSS
jgi:hypothetical protein